MDDNNEKLMHVSSGCNKKLQSPYPSTIQPSVVEEVSLLQPAIISIDQSNEVVSHFDQKIKRLSENPDLPEFLLTLHDVVRAHFG